MITKEVLVGLMAALCTLALIAVLGEAKVQVDCIGPTEREHLRSLALQGIDDGFHDQIQHLFEVWLKDQSDQPRRAMVGTNNAVNAHMRARKQILAWDPPAC